MILETLALIIGTLPQLPPPVEYLEAEKRRVAGLIEALGDPDYEVRCSAHEILRKMLPGIEPVLRQNATHDDAEVAARCRDLLAELERKRAEPRRVFVGKVLYVGGKINFVLMSLESREFAKTGMRFEILRAGLVVAKAEFEKTLGSGESFAKLRIVEGRAADVLEEDQVMAIPPLPAAPPVAAGVGAVAPMRGKIVCVDGSRGLIAVDLSRRAGVQVGDRLDVRRDGKRVGILVIWDVQVWGSWAKPEAEAEFEGLQKGDRVERVEKK